jgi:hypothetical protein
VFLLSYYPVIKKKNPTNRQIPESKKSEIPRIRTEADPGIRRVALFSFFFRQINTRLATSDKTKANISGDQTISNCAITYLYFQGFECKRNDKGDSASNQQVSESVHHHRNY